ncbi:MAG: VCBS repeat-containing protein [Verrucomicrobiae bacterium]|nr:VCBS repeat-containing protein [Verrucomicrobiae bacterium]
MIAALCGWFWTSGSARSQGALPDPIFGDPSLIADENTIHPLATKHCSGCHLPPRPGSMTQKGWAPTFLNMVQFMRDQQIPIIKDELNWLYEFYITNSPAEYTMPPDDFGPMGLKFVKSVAGDPPRSERPAITHIQIVDLDQDGRRGALVCDDERSQVSWVEYQNGEWTEKPLAAVNAPVKTATFDFEGDGDRDIVVAGLGYLHPTDEKIGEAHLLINQGDETFKQIGLIKDVERIADVQPGDFDGDGDTDFVIAHFGWRKTGGLSWMEQESPTTFRRHDIIKINGPMRLEVLDQDDDGDDDFVVLITQQHESLVLFTNDGKGNFTNQILIRATHPAYGSSSFQMVDMDGDGDRDILQTNGDMMDENPEWKPFHGVRWFEKANGNYTMHELAAMPGCYFARAVDMDGDGDLDVVASTLNFFWDVQDFPSLVWFENDGSQQFTKRLIAHAPSNLANFDVGDLNGDGRPDILAGGMHIPGPLGRVGRLTVWMNEGPDSEASKSD